MTRDRSDLQAACGWRSSWDHGLGNLAAGRGRPMEPARHRHGYMRLRARSNCFAGHTTMSLSAILANSKRMTLSRYAGH
jgi:hypothetical protein